jgi:hypothetical protein
MALFTQRLTSFTLRDTFKNRNPKGLLVTSGAIIGTLALINEYFVHVKKFNYFNFKKLSNFGIKEKQKVLKESLIPKQKPDFVVEWEKKYKTK